VHYEHQEGKSEMDAAAYWQQGNSVNARLMSTHGKRPRTLNKPSCRVLESLYSGVTVGHGRPKALRCNSPIC